MCSSFVKNPGWPEKKGCEEGPASESDKSQLDNAPEEPEQEKPAGGWQDGYMS